MPNPFATRAEVEQAIAHAGGISALAREQGIHRATVRRWRDELDVVDAPKFSRDEVLGKVADLLERNGIDIEDVDEVQSVRLNTWEMGSKGEDGEPRVTPLEAAQVVFRPKRPEGPSWPVVQPADLTRPPRPVRRVQRSGGWKTELILPDPQIGYRRDIETAELDPFHDERAIEVAIAVARIVQPDGITNLGDTLDLAELSRFVREPTFALTTKPTVQRATEYLEQQIEAAPGAHIKVIEGNHEARLPRQIMENAAWAFGLTRGRLKGELPAAWPVLTVPNLLRMDDLGVEYVPGYPAGITWINDRLACVHGSKVRSSGSTAAAVIDDERVSVIFGHIHRIELQHKTRRTREGGRSSLAASPGCLCRIDGAVPSTKGAVDPLGRAMPAVENWQQGIAVVTYRDGDSPFHLELVPIHDGFALFRGEAIEASPLEEAA